MPFTLTFPRQIQPTAPPRRGGVRSSRGLRIKAIPSVVKVFIYTTPNYQLGRYARWTDLAGTLKAKGKCGQRQPCPSSWGLSVWPATLHRKKLTDTETTRKFQPGNKRQRIEGATQDQNHVNNNRRTCSTRSFYLSRARGRVKAFGKPRSR